MPFDGAFSPLHWLIVAVVALLVLGPDQLPAFAHRAGEALRDLRRVREHLGRELRDLVSEFDLDQTPDAGSPPCRSKTTTPLRPDCPPGGRLRTSGSPLILWPCEAISGCAITP